MSNNSSCYPREDHPYPAWPAKQRDSAFGHDHYVNTNSGNHRWWISNMKVIDHELDWYHDVLSKQLALFSLSFVSRPVKR